MLVMLNFCLLFSQSEYRIGRVSFLRHDEGYCAG